MLVMTRADLSSPRRLRLGVVVTVAVLHVLVLMGLMRAFAPDFTGQVIGEVAGVLTVTVSRPEPTPTPTPTPSPEPAEPRQAVAEVDPGEAAPPAETARPKEVAAPRPKIVLAEQIAPPVASTGNENRSGASDRGEGTGAGGEGEGTGAGGAGDGQGGGGGIAAKAVKIAGDINSARDYPRATRELRLNDSVVIALTIGTDGRVKDCRIHRPSRDPEADRITCRLATERFRFRPALDARGNPVESLYGWQQRWFRAGGNQS